MKKNYITPALEIESVSDVITTSQSVETERIPLENIQAPTGVSGFSSNGEFFNI